MNKILILLLLPVLSYSKIKIVNGMVQPMKYENVSIESFLADYAQALDITLLSGKLSTKNKKVNFSISKELPLKSFKEMFLTILSSKGYAVVKDKSFSRVISSRDIRYGGGEFYTSSDFPRDDRYVMVFHELRNPLAHSIARNMRPFMSRYGRIINFNDGHSIVIHDRGDQIDKILGIMSKLDNKKSIQTLAKLGVKKKKKRYSLDSKSLDELKVEKLKLEEEILKRKIEKRSRQ